MSNSAVSKVFAKSLIITAAALAFKCSAARISTPGGVSVEVDETHGAYSVSTTQPAWTFEGGLNLPLQHVKTSHGHNSIGDYAEVAFEWKAGATPMKGFIRIYDRAKVAEPPR